MEAICPEIKGHIVPEESVITLAAWVNMNYPNVKHLLYITDESDWNGWSGNLLRQYNGVADKKGRMYKFETISHIQSPRVSSASELRAAVKNNDKKTFYIAASANNYSEAIKIAKLKVNGFDYFSTVKNALNKFQNKQINESKLDVNTAVNFHKKLNPVLWKNFEMKPKIRNHLLMIAETFIKFLEIPIKPIDITISGSNAGLTYTKYSDIDLHVLYDININDKKIYRNLFDSKKSLFNLQHNINVKGYSVELYVQLTSDVHTSAGVFSILHDKWITKPKPIKASINDDAVRSKARYFIKSIARAIKNDDIDKINSLWEKIKNYRKSGLEKNGELGTENVVFKLLRNTGKIEKIIDFKTKNIDKMLSLDEVKYNE